MPISNRLKSSSLIFTFGICVAFFLSGAAGLFYQVSWQRLLTLNYGVGPVSTTLVVSLFMFGLGLGSLVGGFWADKSNNPIRLYICIELALALFGALSIHYLKLINPLLGHPNFLVSSIFVISFLLIPTLLMGMTLPIVVKILSLLNQNFQNSLSLLYFANTMGAAIGALISSYGLISFFGLDSTIYAAAAINFILAFSIALLYFKKKIKFLSSNNRRKRSSFSETFSLQRNHILVIATGFLAIGYQIVWFRLINIIVKSSPYAFSSILFVYLLGIAAGSYWLSKRNKKTFTTGRDTFFLLNFGIALWVLISTGWFFHSIDSSLLNDLLKTSFKAPLHPIYHPNTLLFAKSSSDMWHALYVSLDIFIWPVFFLLIPTMLMGASFPLITSLSSSRPDDEGLTTGTFYWWNIFGNTLGGICTGFIFLPWLGTEITIQVFTSLGILWIFFVRKIDRFEFSPLNRSLTAFALVFATIFVLPKKGELYLRIHESVVMPHESNFIQEDIGGVIFAQYDSDTSTIFINGLAHGRYPDDAFNVEVSELISHKPDAKTALIIGLGAGNIADLLLRYPSIEKVTVVEISHALVEALRNIPFYQDLLKNPKLELVIDDGRRFLNTSNIKYDIVTMDPLRSTTAYSNNLYSKEFFKLVDANLNPDGVMMAWMNEYTIIPKTVAETFDRVKMFYYFLLASNSKMESHTEVRTHFIETMSLEMQIEVMKRINKPYYYRGDKSYVLERGRGYPYLTDFKPWTEYYFGLNLRKKLRYWPLRN